MSQAHADCPHCRQDGSEAKHIALKEVRIALAGNPNCGKTTAFNEYTGTHQHVGNYPGVTVDKKEGYVSIDGVEVLMVDLPGTYSLTAYSQEVGQIAVSIVVGPAALAVGAEGQTLHWDALVPGFLKQRGHAAGVA